MNLINGQLELWLPTGNNAHNSIVAVSNCGRIRRKNGKVEVTKLRHQINYKGKLALIHRVLCEHFIQKTAEDLRLNRICVDHITHKPNGMNINDIRNMRWATQKENMNFDEARRNMSNSKIKSVFGQLYFKRYGYSAKQNIKQYGREYRYYRKHGKLLP